MQPHLTNYLHKKAVIKFIFYSLNIYQSCGVLTSSIIFIPAETPSIEWITVPHSIIISFTCNFIVIYTNLTNIICFCINFFKRNIDTRHPFQTSQALSNFYNRRSMWLKNVKNNAFYISQIVHASNRIKSLLI